MAQKISMCMVCVCLEDGGIIHDVCDNTTMLSNIRVDRNETSTPMKTMEILQNFHHWFPEEENSVCDLWSIDDGQKFSEWFNS